MQEQCSDRKRKSKYSAMELTTAVVYYILKSSTTDDLPFYIP